MLALPVAILFPALWAFSPSRIIAALVSAAYFLAASRGLPQGVATFYGSDLWPGLLLWLGASLSFVGVHSVLWTKRPGRGRAVRYLAAGLLMGVPPFGMVGWAHPVTAAGVLFPGWGWWGLAAVVATLMLMTTTWWRASAFVVAGFWLWSAATWEPPSSPEGWTGIDLAYGQSLGRDVSLARHFELIAMVRGASGEGAHVVLLPESTLGLWTPTVGRLWRDGLRGTDITVSTGAAVIDRDGYDNVMVAIAADASDVLYRERMPVPIAMWQPWRAWTGQGGGARAHLFANPVVTLAGKRIAPLICYEQLVVWPVLQSMLQAPDLIAATGNGWWTAGTAIVPIQQASVTAWAQLFARPVVTAFNV